MPSFLTLSVCRFVGMLLFGNGGTGVAGAVVRSRLMGLLLVWSTPAVFRMEGLSRCGLKVGALIKGPWAFWRASAARAVKNPTGASPSGGLTESVLVVGLAAGACGGGGRVQVDGEFAGTLMPLDVFDGGCGKDSG